MKVKAISKGFYGGSIKAEGEEFVLADKKEIGKWMEEVEKPAPKPAPKKLD